MACKEVCVRRKLFVILLGDHQHGKTEILKKLAYLGSRCRNTYETKEPKIGDIKLCCFDLCNTCFDSYIFSRAYQEELLNKYETDVETALTKEIGDNWFDKDLIIMPLRCTFRKRSTKTNPTPPKINNKNLAEKIIDLAHRHGFDVIVAYVILDKRELTNRPNCREILALNWDKRWEICNPNVSDEDPNKKQVKIENQCHCLAAMLLHRICAELRR